ncbi:MAG: FprA family A-type flavoprotein [Bacteroidales bacterium]|nr:FprA family A-type flavoprotein [Bacteroidales bacterium]
MKTEEIKPGIYWVGAIDWDVRNFHGYLTQRGTTYNAYLIIDEKVTLIDTVKPNFSDKLISRIKQIIDPSKIDYIVSNHVEMDHSGSIPEIMKYAPNATIITCPKGDTGLKAHFKEDWNFKIVKTGDSVSLGKRSLEFFLTPMVHWPDNMIAYMPEEKILFSNDSLGQHYASSARFDDECPLDIVMEEAKKYYANIVLPYGKQVQKELDAAATLDIKMIAPSHGVIWRSHIDKIIPLYQKWCQNEIEKKAVIVYDTMWKSTEIMANSVLEVFEEKGYKVSLRNLQHNHISDIMTELIDTEYICVGSPTLNSTMMPSVAGFLTYMSGLAPKGRKAISFGSYGWGGKTMAEINAFFEKSGFDIVASEKLKYIPGEEDLEIFKKTLSEAIN